MREIKFRAWDKEDKEMFEVIDIHYPRVTSKVMRVNLCYGDLRTIDQVELMQYTGLKDKNGIEIYEGDIVNCIEYECCGYIAWNESEAGFYFNVLLEDEGYEEECMYDYADGMEVIGNIYENPELLSQLN